MNQTFTRIGEVTRSASSWIFHKSKDGLELYQQHMRDKAIEKQREKESQEAMIAARVKRHHESGQEELRAKEELDSERKKILTVIRNREETFKQEASLDVLRALEEKHQQEMEERQLRHDILLEMLSDDFNTLEHELSGHLKGMPHSDFMRYVLASESTLGIHHKTLLKNQVELHIALQAGVPHYISRTVASMSPKEIGLLKMLSYLNSIGIIDDRYYEKVELSITYNGGTCSFYIGRQNRDKTLGNETLRHFAMFWAKSEVEKSAIILDQAIATIGQVRKTIKDPKLKATIEKEILGAKGWLRTDSL